MLIRCNFPDISYLSETQKNNFQFLNEGGYRLKFLGKYCLELQCLIVNPFFLHENEVLKVSYCDHSMSVFIAWGQQFALNDISSYGPTGMFSGWLSTEIALNKFDPSKNRATRVHCESQEGKFLTSPKTGDQISK